MTAHVYGWSDLDIANRQHYGRGKPADLLEAERELSRAQRNLDCASDTYFEFAHEDDQEAKADYERAMAAYERAWAHYQKLAVQYHARKASDFDPHDNYPDPTF